MDLYTVARPLIFRFNAETAHNLALWWAGNVVRGPVRWLARAVHEVRDPRLAQTLWSIAFANPVGIAAGLDKNAVAIPGLAAYGASHLEIGTLTGQAQPGNDRPRLFRLVADQAVINRMGFNNQGAAAVAARLARRYAPVAASGNRPPCVLGINLGKSKVVPLDQAADDYRVSVRALGAFADYVVVNVSSPNTPNLRDLQGEAMLRPLLTAVRSELDAVAPPRAGRRTPLLLKIAPDLADAGIDAAVDVAIATGCDGLICTNTTITRSGLTLGEAQIQALGAGGLSGAPLRQRATAVLARVARRIRQLPAAHQVPVIGVGGIDSAEAAWEKISHGANLVQVYTALVYHGPGLIAAINQGLIRRCEQAGLKSIADAVGRSL